jgi:hypothetical protein
MPIPENHEANILQSGIHFMRHITQAYGAEEGMKLWDAIASTLDPDIKGKIFIAMLLGEYNDTLTIRLDMVKYRVHVQRVEGIKAIRTVTGLGLKEAKDIHDNLALGKVETITIEPTSRTESIRNLAAVYIFAQ